MYYSQGGFTHDDVYCMPTYLRQFYYKELIDVKKKEQKEMDKNKQKTKFRKPPTNPRFKR